MSKRFKWQFRQAVYEIIFVLGGNVGERFYHFVSSTILDKQERHWLTSLSCGFHGTIWRAICHHCPRWECRAAFQPLRGFHHPGQARKAFGQAFDWELWLFRVSLCLSHTHSVTHLVLRLNVEQRWIGFLGFPSCISLRYRNKNVDGISRYAQIESRQNKVNREPCPTTVMHYLPW